jgi:hypothetical protein
MKISAEEATFSPPVISEGLIALTPKSAGVKICSPWFLNAFVEPVSDISSYPYKA